MAQKLQDEDWEELIYLIQDGKCTPFIGAGAAAGTLPTGSSVAQEWAEEHDYPLDDTTDLARVAQFLAIDRYDMYPKESIRRQFQGIEPPDFSASDEPHAILADLGLPIYITTNYDDFMRQALKDRNREPEREFCRWNRFTQEVTGEESILKAGFEPTPDRPLVYHLHGHLDLPQSMVLTEGDYLDFLSRLSRDQDLLPPVIRTALAGTSLLFVGYSLSDWDFRVLFRGLMSSLGASLGYSSIAVQLPPGGLNQEELERRQRYLDRYFDKIQKIQVRIYWGDAKEFSGRLRQRWEAAQ